jgi:23S rRNA A1618 N6-methylase RlmF
MAFLLDTNCWMQLVRKREQVEEVRALLTEVPGSQLVTFDLPLSRKIGRRLTPSEALQRFTDEQLKQSKDA